jgi:two-component system sensor histidine kinase BaeS
VLAGTTLDPAEPAPEGPVVSAPIQVAGELQGMVVLPPPPRPPGLFGGAEQLLSLPGTLVLLLGTILATVVIFEPARRRLHALEGAAERFGAGEEQVRAPETGHDEIARVARAFNRMADELTSRTEALQTLDRQRRQMLADVSHELRTPLTAMRGYLDTLHMPGVTLDPATRNRYLETVRHETNRLEHIVMDLLDLARHESGGIDLSTRVFAVERVFDLVVRRHERTALTLGVGLRVEVDPSADQMVADPMRIEQAIDNLVANALRQTPKGGTIELRAEAAAGSWRLAVIDSGTGIAPEHLAHVFDRFYKVDPSRTSGTSGSGLGLSIVRAIAERHGGTVTVDSRPGRTEFVIVVPQSQAGVSAAEEDVRRGCDPGAALRD